MKHKIKFAALLLIASVAFMFSCNQQPKSLVEATKTGKFDELTQLPFPENQPSKEASARLYDELHFQRAVQVYLWSIGAMNMVAMRDGQAAALGAGNNVLAIWKDRPNSKMLATTANPDVIYGLAFLDLKDGPLVLEAAPQMQGLLDDFWHRPLIDVGLAGPDQGKGGKFLLLPPGFTGETPSGYYIVKSPTYSVFLFLRAFLVDGKTDAGVKLLEQSRIYPLSQQENPPAMKFPNGSEVVADMDFKRDLRYFESLAEFFNHEPVTPEDMAMRGMAASLGIIKGQPFKPDERMKAILNSAADVAYKMATVISYDSPVEITKVYPDRNWMKGFLGGSPIFKEESYTDLDAQVSMFHKAYSTTPAMVLQMPGKGSQYLGVYRDTDGDFLSGGKSYRFHMPANVPAANYWSIVLYDADTRALLDNGQPFPSIASNSNLKLNADGSADVYFCPTTPKGAVNWIKTVPGRGYFGLMRLYSPTKVFYDQTWKPGDVEKVK